MRKILIGIVVCSALVMAGHFTAMAQPFMPGNGMMQQKNGDQLQEELEKISLPGGRIQDGDISNVVQTIKKAVEKISETKKTTGNKDARLMADSVKTLTQWLENQSCVSEVDIPYLEETGELSKITFYSFPGGLPIDITFNEAGRYRLILFLSETDIVKYADLVKYN